MKDEPADRAKSEAPAGPARPTRMKARKPLLNWSAILGRARDLGLTLSDVVRETGSTLPTIRRQLTALNISLAPADPTKKNIDWRRELRRARLSSETTREIALRLQVSASAVDKAKAKYGVTLRPEWRPRKPAHKARVRPRPDATRVPN